MGIRIIALALSIALLSASPSIAGPCTQAIDRAQAKVDVLIAARASAGPYGSESTAARLHRQPTPGSLAEAEQKIGEGGSIEAALAALDRARKADESGDARGCEKALAEVQKATGP